MQRHGGLWTGRRAWLVACAILGCACSDLSPEADDFPSSREWVLAGQTGSLVPSCGVAPLSQDRRSVPLGDALAVLYASGCPEGESAQQLSLTGPDARGVSVRLEPLGAAGVYLIKVEQSLAAGEYRLALPDSSVATLAVAEAAPLPVSLGRIEALVESAGACDLLTFEWELDADALAHAPLLSLWVRVDGGREQLWVDYGAIEVTATADGAVARLSLPRCGPFSDCLEAGPHVLAVRAEVAGETLQPEPLSTSFDVRCMDDSPLPEANDTRSACLLGRSARPGLPGWIVVWGLILGLRRWRRSTPRR